MKTEGGETNAEDENSDGCADPADEDALLSEQ